MINRFRQLPGGPPRIGPPAMMNQSGFSNMPMRPPQVGLPMRPPQVGLPTPGQGLASLTAGPHPAYGIHNQFSGRFGGPPMIGPPATMPPGSTQPGNPMGQGLGAIVPPQFNNPGLDALLAMRAQRQQQQPQAGAQGGLPRWLQDAVARGMFSAEQAQLLSNWKNQGTPGGSQYFPSPVGRFGRDAEGNRVRVDGGGAGGGAAGAL